MAKAKESQFDPMKSAPPLPTPGESVEVIITNGKKITKRTRVLVKKSRFHLNNQPCPKCWLTQRGTVERNGKVKDSPRVIHLKCSMCDYRGKYVIPDWFPLDKFTKETVITEEMYYEQDENPANETAT